MSRKAYLERLFGLDGRVALVTGGRQGIGEAVALGLAQAGANVAVTSRDSSSLEDVCTRIRGYGVEALALELELTDTAQIEHTVAETVRVFGHLDIVVNNAAVAIHGDPLTYSVDDWDRLFAANLRGPLLGSRSAVRGMVERGQRGRIVNISSTFSSVAVKGRFAYAASKGGLGQLTRSLAVEWAPFGVTVNAVAPATVLTETRVFESEEQERARIAQIPLGRLGMPGDIVGAVLLLAGEAGSFITGQTIFVDGGYTVVRF